MLASGSSSPSSLALRPLFMARPHSTEQGKEAEAWTHTEQPSQSRAGIECPTFARPGGSGACSCQGTQRLWRGPVGFRWG